MYMYSDVGVCHLSGNFMPSYNKFVNKGKPADRSEVGIHKYPSYDYSGNIKQSVLWSECGVSVPTLVSKQVKHTTDEIMYRLFGSAVWSHGGQEGWDFCERSSATYSIYCGPCPYGNRTPHYHYGMEKPCTWKGSFWFYHFHLSCIFLYFSWIYIMYVYMCAETEEKR